MRAKEPLCLRDQHDDSGFSVGTQERPALKDAMSDPTQMHRPIRMA